MIEKLVSSFYKGHGDRFLMHVKQVTYKGLCTINHEGQNVCSPGHHSIEKNMLYFLNWLYNGQFSIFFKMIKMSVIVNSLSIHGCMIDENRTILLKVTILDVTLDIIIIFDIQQPFFDLKQKVTIIL